ncbi:MAG: CDC48 family AAA ATPase [Candidatus Altiarchaeota archaeon]|nr:CDC48 family AAA ATPase [Candidatus Altiarchaeota archaeon]
MAAQNIDLKVAEALQNDVGRGIVRMDSESSKAIGVTTGDIVEITGTRTTAAKVWQSHQQDEGMKIIRMDGLIRQNSGTSLGDKVKVKKAAVSDAKKVGIAPTRHEISFGEDFSNYVKQRILMGRPLVTGDVFYITILGQAISFTVISAKPKGITKVNEDTVIEVKATPQAVSTSATPVVRYEDIGGLKDEVSRVREMIELPMKHPELFEKLGIQPPKGVLLYGPPGTGKTMLAKAVASESNANFIHINGPEVMDKFYGESERKLRDIFEEAQQNAPSIIFIDEIDSIATKRDETRGEVERRVVAQLLALMDGLITRGNVIVVAATNRPDSLDPALRRPGRFDREIEIGVPDKNGRREILQIHTRAMPLFHWDDEVLARTVRWRIDSFRDNSDRKIETLKSRIDSLNAEKTEKQKELKETIDELMEVEKEEKKADEAYLKKILSRIGVLKSRTDEIKTKIEGLSGEISSIKREIEKINRDLEKVEKIKQTIDGNKKFLDDLVDELNEIKHAVNIRGRTDVRNIFSEKKLDEIKEDMKKVVKDLLDAEIISDDFVEEVVNESISLMLDELASTTHGFVGADLSAISREAAMNRLKTILPKIDLEKDVIPSEVLEELIVTKEDFMNALKMVEPSALREVMVEVPTVKWTDIGGLENVKQELMEVVEWSIKNPDAFKRLGIKAARAILLYGPSGTGKTLLAKAVANESEANFIAVKGPELLSMWVGESEKGVREIFKKARQTAPTIVFFDEIDALAPRRGSYGGSHVNETVVNQILTEMDGIESLDNVIVIGATNRPDILDPSLLRPGRFDRMLLVPMPDRKARKSIFEIHTKGMPLNDVSIEELVRKTEGFSGADIEAVCREAGMNALREDINSKEVTAKHFQKALEEVKPSVSDSEAKSYLKSFRKDDVSGPAYT